MLALKTPPNNNFGTDSISDHIKIIHKKAENFAKQLQSSKAPKPSFSQLMQFRMQKKLFTQQDTKELFPADFQFWSNRPNKSYHVKARINPVYNTIAKIF